MTSLLDKFARTVNDLPSDDVPSLELHSQTTFSSDKKDCWYNLNELSNSAAEQILPLNKVHVRRDNHAT